MTQYDLQNQQADSGKLHWHPAFQGAMQLAWRRNKHDLEIQGNVHLENLTHDLGKKLISMGEDFKDEDDKRDVNAVLHLTLKKHQKVFKQIFAEADMVFYDAYKEFFRDVIFADEIAQAKAELEARGEARGVISMGREFGLSDIEIIGHISSKLNCSQTEATSLFQKYGSALQAMSE